MKKQRFSLYVQFLSMAQNSDIFFLLNFPEKVFNNTSLKAKASMWSMGKSKYKTASNINEIIEWAKFKKMNDIKISYEFEPINCKEDIITITDVQSLLTISPTNKNWVSTDEYRCKEHKNEQIRLSYESSSKSLHINSIKIKPTILESVIKITSNKDIKDIYKWVFDLFQHSLKQVLRVKGMSGYISLRNIEEEIKLDNLTDVQYLNYIKDNPLKKNEYSMFNILDRLAPYPKTYSLLGTYFGDLYPMLIGNYNLCKGLKEVLGEGARFAEVKSNSSEQYGIVWIPSNVLRNKKTREKASLYLVKQNESTAAKKDNKDKKPSLGEFELKDKSIHMTRKRSKKLLKEGIIEEINPFHYYLWIEEKYCQIIGVDPDEMVVHYLQEEFVKLMRNEIDSEYNELSEQSDLKQRIWQAHIKIWEKYFRYLELFNFIKEKYFADKS